jgi:hypothetical protein
MRLVILLAAALALAAAAWADGKFVSTTAAEPSTPRQRGLVHFENGVETLIVESALDAPDGDYVWIVPVPAAPTSVEAIGPGALETAVRLLSPAVETTGYSYFVLSALIWLAVMYASIRAVRMGYSSREYVTVIVLFSLGLAIAIAFYTPVFAGPGHSSPAAAMKDWGSIGSYEVRSFSGSGDESVRQLEEFGARLSAKERSAIESYAREGWSFLVAKLKKSGAEIASPHPLKVVFPTQNPIYPMRLTATAGAPLTLELVVVGSGSARVRGLEIWRSVRSQPATSLVIHGFGAPQATFRPIGHPAIGPLAGGKGVFTYLRSELRPAQMKEDLEIEIAPYREFSKELLTHGAAIGRAGAMFLFSWALWTFLGTALGLRNRRSAQSIFGFVFWIGCLAAALLAGSAYVSADKVETAPSGGIASQTRFRRIAQAVSKLQWDGKESFEAKVTAALEDVPQGDEPGGYTVERTDSGWKVTVYDRYATPYELEFEPSRPGTPQTSD